MTARWVCLATLALAASIASAAPFTPSDDDLEIVAASLASKMLLSEDLRISNVVAVDRNLESGTMTWVCGWVQPETASDSGGEPMEFVGSLVANNDGDRIFVPIKIAGRDPREKAAVLRLCAQFVAEDRGK